jgi:hypothetical protein
MTKRRATYSITSLESADRGKLSKFFTCDQDFTATGRRSRFSYDQQESAVKFVVTLKGMHYFSGRLEDIYQFIEVTWGSHESAWERGVKVTPATAPPAGH